MLESLAKERQVTLKLSAPDKCPNFNGNKEALQMLFTNLIHNGIKYNKKPGEVSVTIDPQDNQFIITISDTGVGIPKDKLELIFEQFYRIKREQSTESSGLGLSIAKTIVEAHQGSIAVQSEEGQGSDFIISLPL